MPPTTRAASRAASATGQQASANTRDSWVNQLQPVPATLSRNPNGSFVTQQQHNTIVTRNNIIINRASRAGIDIRPEATSLGQPEPIIGVAPQPQSNEEVDSSSTINNIARNINLIINNIYSRFLTERAQQQPRANRRENVRATLEQKINQLYNVNSELLQFLNVEQLLYLSKNNISTKTMKNSKFFFINIYFLDFDFKRE